MVYDQLEEGATISLEDIWPLTPPLPPRIPKKKDPVYATQLGPEAIDLLSRCPGGPESRLYVNGMSGEVFLFSKLQNYI